MINRNLDLRHYVVVALLVGVIFAVYFIFVPPTPDIPLNDDWAYAQSVRHLLNTGELHISDWATAASVPQIYWGALFARLAGGFSFVALRWSTIVCALISCLALYDLLRQLGLQHAEGLLGALLLLVNPIFVNLTYTFMSDIPFLALMILSLACYARGFQRRSKSIGWLLAGGVFAALAYLERQIGVLISVAALIAWVLHERRWTWRPALLIGLLPALTALGHQVWLRVNGTSWAMENIAAGSSWSFIMTPGSWITIGVRAVWGVTYLGIFTLPALAAWRVSRRSLRSTHQLGILFSAWLIIIGVPLAVFISITQLSMPQLANIVNHAGLGAITLPGTKVAPTPAWWFWAMTLVAPFAGAAQAALWTEAVIHWRRERQSFTLTLFLASVMMFLASIVFVYFWDRYLLVLVPCAAFMVLRRTTISRAGWLAASATGAALMAYTLAGMSDYLTWTTARWNTASELVTQGIAPENINAGIEWVGWHEFEQVLPIARANGQGNELLGWMNINPKIYLLAFEPLPGYAVVKEETYPVPLADQVGHIFVLRRQ